MKKCKFYQFCNDHFANDWFIYLNIFARQKKITVSKKLALIGLVSVTLLILIYISPLWIRFPGGLWIPLIFLLVVAGFIWLLVKLIKEIIGLIKNRRTFKWSHLLPTILIVGVLCFTFFNTLSFGIEDRVYGKVTFRACYEGTQNQATFKLREGNRFEIHWTGVFFYDEYFTGTYRQIGDTLILDYHTDNPTRFGDRIFMDNQKELLTTIRQEKDSLKSVVPFYYGYCKGLN